MEAIIFVGVQGCGKSTYFRDHFFDTHIRINLDMLKKRNRETALIEACIAAKQSFVVDNTNPSVANREWYIAAAKAAGFDVIAYYFDVDISVCIWRNDSRKGKRKVPLVAMRATKRVLVPPSCEEGFDEVHHMELTYDGNGWMENHSSYL